MRKDSRYTTENGKTVQKIGGIGEGGRLMVNKEEWNSNICAKIVQKKRRVTVVVVPYM